MGNKAMKIKKHARRQVSLAQLGLKTVISIWKVIKSLLSEIHYCWWCRRVRNVMPSVCLCFMLSVNCDSSTGPIMELYTHGVLHVILYSGYVIQHAEGFTVTHSLT